MSLYVNNSTFRKPWCFYASVLKRKSEQIFALVYFMFISEELKAKEFKQERPGRTSFIHTMTVKQPSFIHRTNTLVGTLAFCSV